MSQRESLKPNVIKGEGFHHGGFETLTVNGKDYHADEVAQAIAAWLRSRPPSGTSARKRTTRLKAGSVAPPNH